MEEILTWTSHDTYVLLLGILAGCLFGIILFTVAPEKSLDFIERVFYKPRHKK